MKKHNLEDIKRKISCPMVDFPLPDSPTKAVISFSLHTRETLLRASFLKGSASLS